MASVTPALIQLWAIVFFKVENSRMFAFDLGLLWICAYLSATLGLVFLGSGLQSALLCIRGSCKVPGRQWAEAKLNYGNKEEGKVRREQRDGV